MSLYESQKYPLLPHDMPQEFFTSQAPVPPCVTMELFQPTMLTE